MTELCDSLSKSENKLNHRKTKPYYPYRLTRTRLARLVVLPFAVQLQLVDERDDVLALFRVLSDGVLRIPIVLQVVQFERRLRLVDHGDLVVLLGFQPRMPLGDLLLVLGLQGL